MSLTCPPDPRLPYQGLSPRPARLILENADLSGANLADTDLQGVILSNADLTDATFVGADLRGANLKGANLSGANLEAVQLGRADLEDVRSNGKTILKGVVAKGGLNLENARLPNCDLSGMEATYQPGDTKPTTLSNVDLNGSNLSNAVLNGANLTRAKLQGADLTNCSFVQATFQGGNFAGATISGGVFDGARFLDKHPVMHDGSESLRAPGAQQYLAWPQLRFASTIPLFGVSWSALILSLATVNAAIYLNSSEPVEWFQYPVPVPFRMKLILLSSILLVVGSTTYASYCPIRVKEFSEVQYVEQLGHPRPVYRSDALARRPHFWVAATTTFVGGALALFLVGERLWNAAAYLVSTAGTG